MYDAKSPLSNYAADYERHLGHLPPEVAAACIQAQALDGIGRSLYYALSVGDTSGKGVFEAIAMALAGDGLRNSVGDRLADLAQAVESLAVQLPTE